MNLVKAALVAAVSLALASCVSLFGVNHDPELEQGLAAYNRAVVAFIKSAELNDIPFGSPTANAFYAQAAGDLAALQLRADIAGGSRECPLAQLAGLALAATEEAIRNVAASLGAGELEPVDTTGNCFTIVVRGVRLANAQLERDHRLVGVIGTNLALLHEEEVTAAVRVAAQTVQAWRP